jgi:hypothetical protein
MPKLRTLVAGLIICVCNVGLPASAADRYVPPRVKAERAYCGCCGCLRVTYDYHRELRSTYGTHFDPRNYDQTEPHYYFGRVRAYPQYWNTLGGYEPHY